MDSASSTHAADAFHGIVKCIVCGDILDDYKLEVIGVQRAQLPDVVGLLLRARRAPDIVPSLEQRGQNVSGEESGGA